MPGVNFSFLTFLLALTTKLGPVELLTIALPLSSKKSIIENAIREYSKKIEADQKIDILEQTCGAWQRSETPKETVKQIRNVFRKSMERHKR